jgi:hypothetical protein
MSLRSDETYSYVKQSSLTDLNTSDECTAPPFFLPRDMDEDVSIVLEHPEKRQVVLPRGSRVVIDMVGSRE